MSASLNREAHAVEHCGVDRASLGALDSALGRQVLVRRSLRRIALYTATELVPDRAPATHLGTEGLARLRTATEPPLPPKLDATLETDFTEGDPDAPIRLTEELLGESASGLAILAPHGGQIEPGTDSQARSVYDALAPQAKPVRAWIASGFNPATGAHKCWHITSSEISELSFPKLGSLFGPTGSRRQFAHAVAFHGNNDSEAIIVGGGRPRDDAHTALKMGLRSAIEKTIGALTDAPPAVEVRLFGPLAGVLRDNIVNRITARGNGIQLEQPPAARADPDLRDAIAHAVAEFYADLV